MRLNTSAYFRFAALPLWPALVNRTVLSSQGDCLVQQSKRIRRYERVSPRPFQKRNRTKRANMNNRYFSFVKNSIKFCSCVLSSLIQTWVIVPFMFSRVIWITSKSSTRTITADCSLYKKEIPVCDIKQKPIPHAKAYPQPTGLWQCDEMDI